MVWIIAIATITGYNFFFWSVISLVRFITEYKLFPPKEKIIFYSKYKISDIAAVIPAHNEEKTIRRTLNALLKIIPKKNIYVASDNSTDRTNKIVRSLHIKLLNIHPNKGKAKALVKILRHYKLLKKYKIILINDADTEIDKNYLNLALPLFYDPSIAAVATHGVSRIKKYNPWQKYFIAYRIRLWRIIQIAMRFGQTWKYTNVSFIIPGSLSLYRADVLRKLEIDAPGLVIEDFNMTFEVHKKKLGKIAYRPNIFGVHQDPYTLNDYIRQVQRWNLGFFQTVKRHGIWFSFFWLATTAYYVELYVYALFFAALPFVIVFLLLYHVIFIHVYIFTYRITLFDVLIGVFAVDYLLTVVASMLERKPILLLYGLGFIFLRYIDSIIYILAPFRALLSTSEGVWKSPKRL